MIKRYVRNHRETLHRMLESYCKWLPDKICVKILYFIRLEKRLNIKNPRAYNEKLQWLNLYNRKPEYVDMADKYTVKKWVASVIGEQYVIPTLGVWDRFEDIDFETLPDKFVLKCTHDCGSIVVCREKNSFDREAARQKLSAYLKRNFYYHCREWQYKRIKPRIIAEENIDDTGMGVPDYKFFCFNGEVKIVDVVKGRWGTEATVDYYDENFCRLPVFRGRAGSNMEVKCPENFNEMKRIAKKLSTGIPHVRVDLYEADGNIYFGEMTFSPAAGMLPFEPIEWEYKIGEWIKLPKRTPYKA